jgi:hypothetical protein
MPSSTEQATDPSRARATASTPTASGLPLTVYDAAQHVILLALCNSAIAAPITCTTPRPCPNGIAGSQSVVWEPRGTRTRFMAYPHIAGAHTQAVGLVAAGPAAEYSRRRRHGAPWSCMPAVKPTLEPE